MVVLPIPNIYWIIHVTLLFLTLHICKRATGRTVPPSVLFIKAYLVEHETGLVPAHFAVTLCESK